MRSPQAKMRPRGSGLVENEEQDENKKMKSIVVKEQEQEQDLDLDRDTLHHVLKRVNINTLGRAACVNKLWRRAAWDNEHYVWKCKRMNPWYRVPRFVMDVTEQEEGSETGFGDLNFDTLLNVLKRVDVVTIGRAACVNKKWCKVTWQNQIWHPIVERIMASIGLGCRIDYLRRHRVLPYRLILSDEQITVYIKFYSIDFSKMIGPWV